MPIVYTLRKFQQHVSPFQKYTRFGCVYSMVYDLTNGVRNSTASAHALDFAGINRENMAAFAKAVYALLLEGEEQETLWRVYDRYIQLRMTRGAMQVYTSTCTVFL